MERAAEDLQSLPWRLSKRGVCMRRRFRGSAVRSDNADPPAVMRHGAPPDTASKSAARSLLLASGVMGDRGAPGVDGSCFPTAASPAALRMAGSSLGEELA